MKFIVRGVFGLAMIALLLSIAWSFHVSSTPSASTEKAVFEEGRNVAEPREQTTVITTAGKGNNYIVAFGPGGTVRYYNDSLRHYNDIDPSPVGDHTVLYVGAKWLSADRCDKTTACYVNVVERVNITTGEVTRLYSRLTADEQNQAHDVDRLDQHRLVFADIAHDRVFIINTTSGVEEWGWNAQSEYDPRDSGGNFPTDWTHLNDVEVLEDGRIMVSLRNHDQVVFIDPKRGLLENWTLGHDDAHDILFEQHNPDYIPKSRGGPAIVVADSENGRLVEYHRRNEGWTRTWQWYDVRMQWPRDVDRLPNGHTLVVDSNGRRVFELNRAGEVVWQVQINGGYDAERLGTGDESTGGESARMLGLVTKTKGPRLGTSEPSKTPAQNPSLPVVVITHIKDLLPSLVVNGLLYILPTWITVWNILAALGVVGISVLWGITEFRWSSWKLLKKED